MPEIRPVSDLRNNFTEISRIVHETSEPVFLTKNGYGDMVVMSIEAYEQRLFESDVYFKLREAQWEAKTNGQRLDHDEVFSGLKEEIRARADDE